MYAIVRRLIPGLFALLLTALCAAQTAPATLNLRISAQPLDAALNAWASQTGYSVLIPFERAAKGKMAPKVEGNYTPEAALKILLANSDLKYEFVSERTVAIRSVKPDSGESAKQTDAGGSSASDILLAQALQSTDAASTGTPKKSNDDVQEMLVEGEREKPAPFSTANLDLTRTEDDVLPFTTFTARDIELSGATNLQEFFRKRLSQSFTTAIPEEFDGEGPDVSPESTASLYGPRANRIQMRGWSANETVYLLNGRRMPAQYRGLNDEKENATPNFAMIPLASIERIEILPSAGSAIYGENATAGVINIITRQDFKGGQIAVNYSTPEDVNRPQRGVDFNLGRPLGRGFSLRLGASYSDSDPLTAADRADITIDHFRRLAVERDQTRIIGRLAFLNPLNASTLPYGATPNISTITDPLLYPTFFQFFNTFRVANLFGTGTPNFTTVPAGYEGDGSLADFEPGVFNLDASTYSSRFGTFNSSSTFNVGLDRNFGERWRWSLDFQRAESNSEGRANASFLSFMKPLDQPQTGRNPRVPASAPGNPFGQDVGVRLIDPRMLRPEASNQTSASTDRVSSSLHGGFGEWRGFLDLNFTRYQDEMRRESFWEPYGGWSNALATGAYDPFVDVRTVAPADDDFYTDYIARREHIRSATRDYQADLKVSGPVLNLSGRAVQLTAGLSWARSDRYSSLQFAEYQDAVTGEPQIPAGGTSSNALPLNEPPDRRFVFDSYGAYAEASVPLVSASDHRPLVKQLEMFGSQRLSFTVRNGFRADGTKVSYDDRSQIQALGLRYEPLTGVALRISQSMGYRPPSVTQVTPVDNLEIFPPDVLLPVDDPVRGEEDVLLPITGFVQGGNPDLRPETSDSTNVGLILTPRWLSGSRFSVDYLESVRNDAIMPLGADQVAALEAVFPDRVRRGPPDGHPSGVGPLIFVDYRMVNFTRIASRSLDFSLDQALPELFGGNLAFAASASWLISYKAQHSPGVPYMEHLRNLSADAIPQPIEWNANAQLSWQRQRWGFIWSTHFLDYILVNPEFFLLQGGDRVPWALDHDFSVNYRAPKADRPRGMQWLLSDTSVSFGLKNVFDRRPRFWAVATDSGVAPGDSVAGRSVWLSLRRSF